MLGKKQKILFVTLIFIFVLLAICVKCNLTQGIDETVYRIINNIQTNNLTFFLVIVTKLGGILSLFFIAFSVFCVLYFCKKRKMGIAVILNLMISSSTYIILKNIIQRPRPNELERLVGETGFSFPSGHTTNNTAFYVFAIYLVCQNVKNKKLRIFLSCILRNYAYLNRF